MALERSFSVSLRYCFLIALLILIIHTLSSDYGVNGEDQGGVDKAKLGAKGVTGAKATDAVISSKRPLKRKSRTSPNPLGSVSAKPASDAKSDADGAKHLPSQSGDPLQKPRSPNESDDKGHLKGATGNLKAAENTAVVVKEKEEGEEEETDEDDVVIEKDGKQKTGDSQSAGFSEETYEDGDGDATEIKLNPSGNMLADQGKLRKKPPTEDVSSAGSFMTYFVIVAIIVIIGYLILHNKKKLMGYIVEGRNTGRVRRQRPTTGNGSEYKPLKNADEVPIGRTEEA